MQGGGRLTVSRMHRIEEECILAQYKTYPGGNRDQSEIWEKLISKTGKRWLKIGGIALVLLILFTTSFFTVNDKQQGVVTTFGKVTKVVDAGMHFRLPFGIQKVTLVDVNVYHKIELGYRTNQPAGAVYDTIEKESKMISGDFNIVNVDFFIEYRITNPVKYLYASQDPGEVLKNLAQSQIRNVIGSTTVDDILTTGKSAIQASVKTLITDELNKYDIGIVLTDIKIQDAEPPTEEVKAAFKNVETAKQQGETAKNDAEAYKNEQLPSAQARADALLQNAVFRKTDRINEAVKQVAMFNAMFSEYIRDPEITRSRMYFETIEKILPGVKLIIDAGDGSTQKLLPLDQFLGIQ